MSSEASKPLRRITQDDQELNMPSNQDLACDQDESHTKLNLISSRYMSADYLLALWESLLPARRFSAKVSTNCRYSNDQLNTSTLKAKHFFNPTTNALCQKMSLVTKSSHVRARQSIEDSLAWKFEPENPIGKQLMDRMRQLLAENRSLGQANHGDQTSDLEAEIENQTTCIREFANTYEEMETVSEEALMDLEAVQTSVLILQQKIIEAESVIRTLQEEIEYRQSQQVSNVSETA